MLGLKDPWDPWDPWDSCLAPARPCIVRAMDLMLVNLVSLTKYLHISHSQLPNK